MRGLRLSAVMGRVLGSALAAVFVVFGAGEGGSFSWGEREPGVTFVPAAKVSYDFSRVVSVGLDYYADYGTIFNPDTLYNQQQQFFRRSILNVSPQGEINFGAGIGPTAGTDRWIVRGIMERHVAAAVTNSLRFIRLR